MQPEQLRRQGAEVTTSLKRLLVKRSDLDKIIAAANALGSGLTSSDLASTLLEALELPDVRLPRFDVLSSSPSTSNHVYGAFLGVFHGVKLVQATGGALNATYAAFKPWCRQATRPIRSGTFNAAFGFLDNAPATTAQVKFLRIMSICSTTCCAPTMNSGGRARAHCACCPPDNLFPRHLMLGLLHTELVSQPVIYRHGFLASSAVSDCTGRTKELLRLFELLVEMTKRALPMRRPLPKANDKARTDPQIRITPTSLGAPLSEQGDPVLLPAKRHAAALPAMER